MTLTVVLGTLLFLFRPTLAPRARIVFILLLVLIGSYEAVRLLYHRLVIGGGG